MRRKRLWILVGILFAVGGVLYLLTSFSARGAGLKSALHTTVGDFNRGEFYLTGMTRRDDGEVTLLAIGLTKDWVPTDVVGLPPMYGHAMVQHNGYIYVIGGRLAGNELTRGVYFSHINTETHMLEPFTTTTPLPESYYPTGVFRHTAVAVGDYLYVIGGEVDTAQNPSSQGVFASFNQDGTLGNWTPLASLPEPRARVPAVELNGYIYLVSGMSGVAYATDRILYAQPDPATGEITLWLTATATSPYPAFGHMVAAYGDHLYFMSGYDMWQARPDVYFARPLLTGDIPAGEWTLAKSVLPTNMYGSVALVLNGELFTIGGVDNFPLGNPVDFTRAALLDIVSGEIITSVLAPGGWIDSPALSPGRVWQGAALGPNNQYIYVLGGTEGGLDPLTTNMLNVGSTSTEGETALGYAESGWYIGPMIDLGLERLVRNFNWTTESPDPGVTMTLYYRTRSIRGDWGDWVRPAPALREVAGDLITYTVVYTRDFTAYQFEYRADFSTNDISKTAALHRFEVVYEEAIQPDFYKLAKPPSGQDVLQNQRITYTMGFSNPNDYALSNVEIVDTLPPSLTYVAGSISYAVNPGVVITAYDSGLPVLRWVMASLPAGLGGKVSYVAEVAHNAPAGTLLKNDAQLESDNTFPEKRSTMHYVAELRPLALVKTAIPDSALVWTGQELSYTLTYSNPNNFPLRSVVISDIVPTNTTFVPGSCNPTCTQSGNVLDWDIGGLENLEESQVQFAALVNPAAASGTVITNTGYGHGCETGTGACTQIAASNPVTHTVVDKVPPEIVKQANPPSGATVSPGTPIRYTLEYTNNAVLTLTRVIISDVLPISTTLVSGCESPDCTVDGDELHWVFSGIPPHESGQAVFTVTVQSAAVSGTVIANTARIIGCAGNVCTDSVPSAQTTHRVVIALIDLRITKRATPSSGQTVSPRDLITYTLAYTNSSSNELIGVIVSDTLPPGVQLVNGSCAPTCTVSNGVLTWAIGTLGPEQSGQASFAAEVSDQVTDGKAIQNIGRIEGDGNSAESNAVAHTVIVPYDLVITKSDGQMVAQPGDVLTYTITFTNIVPGGFVTLTNAIITDELLSPCCMEFITTTAPPGWQIISPTATYVVGTLGPNESRSIQLAVRIASTDELPSGADGIYNRVTIADDGQNGQEQDVANNTDEDNTTLQDPQGPDLVLRNIQMSPAQAYVNTPLRISADVLNQGQSPALTWEDIITPGQGLWIAVELYVKPAGFVKPGPPTGPYDHAGGMCLQNVPETVRCPAYDIERWDYPDYPLDVDQSAPVEFTHNFTQTGVYSLYLQVDAANDWPLDPLYGRVKESDESNNIEFLGAITVEPKTGGEKVYLPVVLKNR